MPLTLEGRIMAAERERQADQEFIERYGLEKFQEKLERIGVFGYKFQHKGHREQALNVLHTLGEDYFYKDDDELLKEFKSKYFPKWGQFGFGYNLWSSTRRGRLGDIIIVEKPFPKQSYDQRLIAHGLDFKEVRSYRFAEMTEQELRHPMSWGYWFGELFVDLGGNMRPQ